MAAKWVIGPVMCGRQPVAHVGWEEDRLVTVTRQEVVGHGGSYAIEPLALLPSGPQTAVPRPRFRADNQDDRNQRPGGHRRCLRAPRGSAKGVPGQRSASWTAYSCQLSGTPLSWWVPRSAKTKPAPASRSLTVREAKNAAVGAVPDRSASASSPVPASSGTSADGVATTRGQDTLARSASGVLLSLLGLCARASPGSSLRFGPEDEPASCPQSATSQCPSRMSSRPVSSLASRQACSRRGSIRKYR